MLKGGEVKFLASYDFDIGHELSFNFNKEFSNGVHTFQRELEYNNGIKTKYLETRNEKPESNDFTLKYRRKIYGGARQSMFLSIQASVNNMRNNENQSNFNNLLGGTINNYKSVNKSGEKHAELSLMYYLRKNRFKVNFSGNLKVEHANEIASREQLDDFDNWENLINYENDVSILRVLPNVTIGINSRLGESKNSSNKKISFSIKESYLREVINNRISDEKQVDNSFSTGFLGSYSQSFKSYGYFSAKGNGAMRWPSISELVSSPVYIDEKNIVKGNPALKPQATYKIGLNLKWNPSGVIRISFDPSGGKSPNYGFSLGLDHSISENKIIPVYSLDDSGVMVQSYDNGPRYKAFSTHASKF